MLGSFDYGDTDSTGEQSFVQLLSTTNLNEALPEFIEARNLALASLPPQLPPLELARVINGTRVSSDGSAGDSGDLAENSVGGDTSAPSASGGVSDPTTSSGQLYSLVEKYGPVVIGLLAGNTLIGVVLCVISLFVCMKRAGRSRARTRTLESTYVPVRFKEADAAEESGVRYND